MSIRPIDIQTVLPKTQDIHPAKQSVINKQDHELVHAQQENKMNTQRNMKRVSKKDDAETKKIKNDKDNDKEKKKSKKNRKNKKKMKSEKEKSKQLTLDPDEELGTRFDMKV